MELKTTKWLYVFSGNKIMYKGENVVNSIHNVRRTNDGIIFKSAAMAPQR